MMTQFTPLAFALLIICTISGHAQNSADDVELVTSTDIQNPKFPGGDQALQEHIQKRLDQELIKSVDKNGKVFVKFTVDKKGRTKKVEVIPERSTVKDEKVWEECKRVISELPWWAPAREGDKKLKVRMSYSIEIN